MLPAPTKPTFLPLTLTPAARAGAAVELTREVDAIDGVDDIEQLERLADFVRLQVPDEMPRHRSPELRDLVTRLLDPILAERAESRRHRGPNPSDVDRLG